MTTPINKNIQIEGPLLRDFLAPKMSERRNQSLILSLDRFGMEAPEDSYAIQAHDDEMAGAGIARGDIAILAPVGPRSGDIVAARLEGSVCLRRYVVIQGIPHLLTENPDAPNLMAAYNIPMPGLVWALVRLGVARHRIVHEHRPKVRYSAQGGLKSSQEFSSSILRRYHPSEPSGKKPWQMDLGPDLPPAGVNERLSDPTPAKGYQVPPKKKASLTKTRRKRSAKSISPE